MSGFLSLSRPPTPLDRFNLLKIHEFDRLARGMRTPLAGLRDCKPCGVKAPGTGRKPKAFWSF